MIGCGLAARTAHMNDDEFWSFVFPQPEENYDPHPDDAPDMFASQCVRCGEGIIVEDWAEACERQDEAFCDECADAHLPDEEVTR